MRKEKGFTLLEMAAAIAVIAVLLPFIMLPFANMLLKGGPVGPTDQSAFLAERKLEEMLGVRFTQLSSVSAQSFSAPYDAYQWAVNVDYVQNSRNLDVVAVGTSNYKRAKIVVTSLKGNPYTVTMLYTN